MEFNKTSYLVNIGTADGLATSQYQVWCWTSSESEEVLCY